MIFRIFILACLVSCGCCGDDQGLPENFSPDSTDVSFTNLKSNSSGTTETATSILSEETTTNLIADILTDKIIIAPAEEVTTDNSITEASNSTTDYDDGNEEVTTYSTTSTTETNVTACSSKPCRNGGTCIQDLTTSSLFSCDCSPGFVGIRCGTEDKCEDDEDGVLCSGGTCKNSDDDLVRSCACFFNEHWDSYQKKCRESDLPCFPNPCLNDGKCMPEDSTYRCDCKSGFESKNCSVYNDCGDCTLGKCLLDEETMTKHCLCNDGLYWNTKRQTCEELTSPCLLKPCQNDGTCYPITNETFNCSCAEGFSGQTCEVIDKCTEDADCGGHGTCTLSEDESVRKCECQEDFFLNEQSNTCEEKTSCNPNPCLHDGICATLSGSVFNCTCAEGYTGPICNVRNMCDKDGGKGFCTSADCMNVHELEVYVCICEEGQYFDYVERKCLDLDLCPLMQCTLSERCVGGRCECLENWDNSTGTCKPNFCSFNLCPATDMLCEEGSGSEDYKCSCRDGHAFNGTHCNEVSCAFPSLNECSQKCELTEEGYACGCAKGFHLEEDNKTCSFEGNTTCSNKTCDGGSCYEENGEEMCVCSDGYVEKEGNCIDICSAGQMAIDLCPSDECEILPGAGFKCKCEGKYALSDDETTCKVRNVCQADEIGWKTCSGRNAKCHLDWREDLGYRCLCENGLIETSGGICCDICSIENNQRICSLNGTICDVDTDGKMVCKCPPYFQKNRKEGLCNKPADVSFVVTLPLDRSTYQKRNIMKRSLDDSLDIRRIRKDVILMARAMLFGFTDATVLSCSESLKYVLCKVELQFSRVEELDLRRMKTDKLCLAENNSDTCILPPSLVLVKNRIVKDVDIVATDPCDDDIRKDVCGSETTCTSSLHSKTFNCSCKSGFEFRRRTYPFANTKSYVDICRDIDECLGVPCPVNSNCNNTIGSYYCSCKNGYRSVLDAKGEKCVEICRPNPCTHGECSTRGDHEFDCTCDGGYRGTFCNLEDKNFKGARINTVIVGVVLGGILLLTIILFVACFSRLKKKKQLEDPANMLYNSSEMVERKGVSSGVINNAYQRE